MLLQKSTLLLITLDHVLQVVLQILKHYILNQLALLVLAVKKRLDLDDIRTTLQHVQHLVLTTHPLTHLLNSLQSHSLTSLAVDRLENIT